MAIANTTLRNIVAGEGDTVHRTIISYPASATYTPGSDITNRTVTGSKETLSISTWLASKVTVDDTEKRQSVIELATNISNKMMKDHNNRIEQAVLAEVTSALWTLDDGNVGELPATTPLSIPIVFRSSLLRLTRSWMPLTLRRRAGRQ